MRRIAPRRLIAIAAVAAVSGTGALVAIAPSAQAATVDYATHCTNPYSSPPDGNVKIDLVVTPAKSTYQVNDVVTVEWQWKLYPKAPPTIPVVGEIAKDSTYPVGTVKLTGAQTGNFAIQGPKINPRTLPGEDLILSNPVGTFTLTQAGQVNLTPDIYSTWTTAVGQNVETKCSPINPIAVSRTLTVEGPSQGQPTVTATPGEFNAGSTVALSGANWAAGTPTVSLCDSNGASCDPSKIAANSLVVTNGALSGSVNTLATVPGGNYKLRVGVGAGEAFAPVKINAVARQISLSPNRGPVGTGVTVTGKNFNPNIYILAYGRDAAGNLLDDTLAYAESAADGSVVIPDFVASMDSITSIILMEGTDETTMVSAPFTIGAALPATLSASPTTTHAGGSVAVTGNNWTPNGTATASLCAADGSACSTARITSGPIHIGADGALAGNVTIAGNVGEGTYKLKLSDGSNSALAAVTVQRRWLELNKTSGSPCTFVLVTGHGYGSLAWVNVNGLAGGSKTSDWAGAWANANGDFSIWILITKTNTTGIVASETFHPDRQASTPFTTT
ncbi:hypothetical protein [Embleya sp. NBC_00896]|uniref:hypothetical protein n=1 Tax=Embleya sp. NBC_00896 TaxID=2975961 RepID=UPI0038699115|nr:hypothetical protein OG928_20910 [Embleya sp. NBC_00896]